MEPFIRWRPLEAAFVVTIPLSLAVLELFHPRPRDLFAVDLRAWLAVHYLQLGLFPLTALALTRLVRGQAGLAAGLCRAAAFVFAVTVVPSDTAAGVVTGILVQAGRAAGAPEAWRPAVLAVWTHPVVGGAPEPAPLLAVASSVAWSCAALAAAVVLRRTGSSWAPVGLLVISALGLSVFRTHAWPGGPVTFAALAAAAAWLKWEQATRHPLR